MEQVCDQCTEEHTYHCEECEVYLCAAHAPAHQRTHGLRETKAKAPLRAKVESMRDRDERGPKSAPRAVIPREPELPAAVPAATSGDLKACHGCDRPRAPRTLSRGLCSSCYLYARRQIQFGRTTEDALVAAGLMDPSRRDRTQPVTSIFAAKIAKIGKP